MIISKNQQYSNISPEFENNKIIQESIALKKEQAKKLKAIENDYQLNLKNKQQEVKILKKIIFEKLNESGYLFKILRSIMKFNEDNVPEYLLERRQGLFGLNYDENQALVVDDLRKLFDDIASTSTSQFSNRYFCNKKISFYNSTICALLSEDPDNYEINLSWKRLNVLPKDIFVGFKNLQVLYLSYNRIHHLESGIFNDLSNLQRLNLDLNKLAALPSDIFKGLEKLEEINLSYNQLNYLEPGTFNNLSNLQRLNLDSNNLPALSSDIFNGLEKLKILDLKFNKLNSIQSGTFNNLFNLQTLQLDINNLTALSSDVFKGLEKLEELGLSYNRLNYLQPDTFNNLSNLERLDLNNNNLTALSSNIFNGLDKLEDLNLSWNELNSLQPGTFNNLSNLKYFRIHGNHITSLPKNIFAGLENLQVLGLSNNRLNYLDLEIFNNLPALYRLDIQGNNLTTDLSNILENKFKVFECNCEIDKIVLGSSESHLRIIASEELPDDFDTMSLSNVIQGQIYPPAHAEVSSILDKFFIDLKTNLTKSCKVNLEYYKNDLKSKLDYQIKRQENITNNYHDGVNTLSLRNFGLNEELNEIQEETVQLRKNYWELMSKYKKCNESHSTDKPNDLTGENETAIQELTLLKRNHRQLLAKYSEMNTKYNKSLATLKTCDSRQEVKLLREIIFEISQKNLAESADLLKTLISIMKFNEDNVPTDLLEKRRQFFQTKYNKNRAVVVDDLRKRFDDIALTSSSQYSNKYFCNKKISYYDSPVCELVSEDPDNYQINLIHKNFAVLPRDIFTGFNNLKKLDLSANRLYYLESSTFNNLSKLQKLNLKWNNLTALSSDMFNGLKKLEELDISYNQLNALQPGTFNDLSNLKSLWLTENHLTSLPEGILNGLKNLENLSIASNQLYYLESSTFNGLSNLRQVWFYKNHLTSLPRDIFTGLEKLNYLDLDSNQLTYLDSYIFSDLPKLTKLFISNNNLTRYLKTVLKNKYSFEVFEL
ncbi:chaoptin-like [Aphidius gifuensis]|uniref:chaoptin-like n=1 Tax=Aphidius gifuensis TaxID=684658 RepID=UPI001CDB81FD|nr:chaoptin-like [Aphidius gifuensis]